MTPDELHDSHHDLGRDADDDILRQGVKRPVRLKGEDIETTRRKGNKAAIGGMRNPRLAVKRLTRLQVTGRLISDILGSFIVEHPALVSYCTRALIDDKCAGPPQNMIDELKKRITAAIGWSPEMPEYRS